MAKYIKSIFHQPEKRKTIQYEEHFEDDKDFTPPLDGRRKLSISRSGRMKQAKKLRHSLSLDLYHGENLQSVAKPASVEYHVNSSPHSPQINVPTVATEPKAPDTSPRSSSTEMETPEEEIDRAFRIIDKS